MILRNDQLDRYMQHIIIPEISRQGQEKILHSSVILFSEDLDKVSLALYYLAAAGVGAVYCNIDNAINWDDLSDKLHDLNSDVKIRLQCEKEMKHSNVQATTRIIAGSPGYVEETLKNILKSDYNEKYIPTIVSVFNGWRGAVQSIATKTGLENFLLQMDGSAGFSKFNPDSFDHKLSGYFSSLMAVIEHLKITLSHGKPLSTALYYDLYAMEFDSIESPASLIYKLNPPKIHESIPKPFTDCNVLIVGCGGMGSAAAYALASLGIGRLGLIDSDTVELNNLIQQIMHSFSRIGISKVQSAEIFLKQINPDIILDKYNSKIGKESIRDIINSYDIVIGCLDNLSDTYILNDACLAAGKPLLEAGALDISALATSIIPGEGQCFSCTFPKPDDESPIPSCPETGVLGAVTGLMGIIQATEAVKLLAGFGRSLKNKMLLFDVFDTDIYIADIERNPYCEFCSDTHDITEGHGGHSTIYKNT